MSVFKYKDKTIMGVTNDAEKILYDNSKSNLTETNVQDAIDTLSLNLGNNVISYNEEDGHFYITSGEIIKKLGSGEGTATAAHVLVGSTFTSEQVEDVTEGTMPNNGAINKKLDTINTSVTIENGYHNGSGTVSLVTETRTVTPNNTVQNIEASNGKVIKKVTVNATPTETVTITPSMSEQTITPSSGKFISSISVDKVEVTIPDTSHILSSNSIYVSSNGSILSSTTGTMLNFGSSSVSSKTLSAIDNDLYITVPYTGYYNTSSKIKVSKEDVKTALGAYTVSIDGSTLKLS